MYVEVQRTKTAMVNTSEKMSGCEGTGSGNKRRCVTSDQGSSVKTLKSYLSSATLGYSDT